MNRIFRLCFILGLIFSWLPTLHLGAAGFYERQGPFEVVEAFWGVQTPTGMNRLDVTPGDQDVTLQLSIRYLGTGDVRRMVQLLNLTYPFTNATGGNIVKGHYPSALREGQIASTQFQLNIDAQAKPGTYRLQVRIWYIEAVELWVDRTLLVEIIPPTPLVVVAAGWGSPTAPTPVGPGDQGAALSVTVQNPMKNAIAAVSLKLRLQRPFVNLTGGDTVLYAISGSLLSGQTTTVQFLVNVDDTAIPSNYFLPLEISYLDPWNTRLSQDVTVPVFLPGKGTLVVQQASGPLIRAETNRLELKIINTGSAPAYAVTATLSLPNLPVALDSQDNIEYYGAIEPRRPASFTRNVTVSPLAVEAAYQATLTLAYKDVYGQSRSEVHGIGFRIQGSVNIEIQNDEVIPSTVGAGGNITITGDLFNRGDVRAQFTEVTVRVAYPLIPTIESRQYVGAIDPDTLVPFSLNLFVDPKAGNGTYQATVMISYQNSFREKTSVEKTYTITVAGTASSPPITQTNRPAPENRAYTILIISLIGGISIVAAALLLYRSRRKRPQVAPSLEPR